MTKFSESIINGFHNYSISYRVHATQRMFSRGISENDVEYVLNNGDVIKRYDEDLPLPSLLINARTPENKQIHVVAAINEYEKFIVIITVYEPDISRWESDFSRRRQ